MESDKQSLSKSDTGPYSVLKYLFRIVFVGLVLLSLEVYFFIRADIIRYAETIYFFIWCLVGFLFVNMLVAMFVVWLPSWHEPKSLKIATLGLGSCLLAFLLFILTLTTILTDESLFPHNIHLHIPYKLFSFDPVVLQIPLLFLSLLLSVIGLVWGNADTQKRNLFDPIAGEVIKLSGIALVASFILMVPACCLLALLEFRI
jgi:hypothetical protein